MARYLSLLDCLTGLLRLLPRAADRSGARVDRAVRPFPVGARHYPPGGPALALPESTGAAVVGYATELAALCRGTTDLDTHPCCCARGYRLPGGPGLP